LEASWVGGHVDEVSMCAWVIMVLSDMWCFHGGYVICVEVDAAKVLRRLGLAAGEGWLQGFGGST
jgi:hypothetical protein